ncbi:MAG: RNA polymerase sigma factor SigJ [Chloroflexales bacterium]|nr:RNA polymerase sigma factor SigJ [Chloroflexales bacterium]
MADPDPFAPHRPALFALAYRLLGSASEAEDVLQDAYLRYATAAPDVIRSHKAYLSTIITRLCLDRLKAAHTRREQYIGPWLPEPLLTRDEGDDPQHQAERHESITLAFLVVLHSLTPPERAAFVLHEVFEYPHADVAAMLGLSAANCRQLFHRAKVRLAAGRPRVQPSSAARQQHLVASFLAAAEQGDVTTLATLLADDVTFWADSGGKTPAPRRPVQGRTAVAALLPVFVANTLRLVDGDRSALRSAVAEVNGEPAILLWLRERLDSVTVCSLQDAQITALRLVRNPEKLDYIRRQLRAKSDASPNV